MAVRRLIRTIAIALTAALSLPVGAATPKQQAAEILKTAGAAGGLVAHLGCGDGALTAALRPSDAYLVHGLGKNVDAARKHIRSLGVYGPVSVAPFDGARLPYADNVVNLLVVEDVGRVPRAEMMRVLVPNGVLCMRKGDTWTKTAKPRPADIDEWTHFLRGPDNNAVAADDLIGQPRELQWVGLPRWGRSHEEMAGVSAAVTTKGRIFYVADEAPYASIRFMSTWRLIARDAFNGVVLWKRDISPWTDHLRHFRSGPLHLPRRLVALGDTVYATLGLDKPVTALDAATGKTVRTYAGTEHTEEILLLDGVLYLVVGTSESKVVGGGLFTRGKPDPTKERYVTAIQADTGKVLWRAGETDGEYVLPTSLTARDGRVFYTGSHGVVCVDAKSGKEVWRTPRPTPAKRYAWSGPTVVAGDGVLLVADRDAVGGKEEAAKGPVHWGVHGWSEGGFARRGKCSLRAHDSATGKELWQTGCSEGYNSAVDVFIIDGLVWIGPGFAQGRDLKTGEVKRTLNVQAAQVGMVHARCHRNKATTNFIFTCRAGVEVIDVEKGWIGNNSWVRGTCQYGILPANGMLYAPPDACGCFPRVKVQGMNAIRAHSPRKPVAPAQRTVKGPAFGATPGAKADAQDWPMYRCNAERGGSVATEVADSLQIAWTAEVGGRLSQPVIADGRAFVVSINSHTLHALDAATGKPLWEHTVGARVDSPPVVDGERVIFGCADGWVTCLRAKDGAVAWRHLAAPEERLITAFGQLESVWPVNGAVLLQGGTVYAAAGRSSYLDGGIRIVRLDPATGKQLSESLVYHLDPATGKQIGAERRGTFDMEGTLSDVLSGDGESIFLKHLRFGPSGTPMSESKAHLFSMTGFLHEEWFVRSYWQYGAQIGAGWGRWAAPANQAPFGRILCFDDESIYGYGRVKVQGGATGHRADATHLFCSPKSPPPAPKKDLRGEAKPKGKGKKPRRPKTLPKTYRWSKPVPIMVRAMAVASDRIVAAGVPDVGKKKSGKALAWENEEEALEAFTGKKGGVLWVVSAKDGAKLSELKLEASPINDGMAAARGKVYLSLRNGKLICLAGK